MSSSFPVQGRNTMRQPHDLASGKSNPTNRPDDPPKLFKNKRAHIQSNTWPVSSCPCQSGQHRCGCCYTRRAQPPPTNKSACTQNWPEDDTHIPALLLILLLVSTQAMMYTEAAFWAGGEQVSRLMRAAGCHASLICPLQGRLSCMAGAFIWTWVLAARVKTVTGFGACFP